MPQAVARSTRPVMLINVEPGEPPATALAHRAHAGRTTHRHVLLRALAATGLPAFPRSPRYQRTASRMSGRQPLNLAKIPVTACLAGGLAILGACSNPADCSVNFRGGCVPATVSAAPATPPAVVPAATPAPATPVPATPGIATPAAAHPAAVRLGEPSEFADLDDKQCRSYGLTFGTRDYADCRIRLSAQHRGLDPNIGLTPSR